MELHRFSLTVILQMMGLGIVGILVVLLNFLQVTNNSVTIDLFMFFTLVVVVVLSSIVLLFPNGWRILSWMLRIGPEPVNINRYLTSQVIRYLVVIDAVGLCILIISTGGASKSIFTPLLFVLPIVAIILSENNTSWTFFYFLFIIIVYGVTLFLKSDITQEFMIEKLSLYNIMRMIVAIVSIAFGVISYLQAQWEVKE